MQNIEFYFYPLIKGIGVGSTSGTEQTLIESHDVFPAGIGGLALPIDNNTIRTGRTSCSGYQLIRSGKFSEFLSTFGENRERWRERQWIRFCREYDWLRTSGTNSLFELFGGYVAVVSSTGQQLKTEIRSYYDNFDWIGQAQIDVYQLQ